MATVNAIFSAHKLKAVLAYTSHNGRWLLNNPLLDKHGLCASDGHQAVILPQDACDVLRNRIVEEKGINCLNTQITDRYILQHDDIKELADNIRNRKSEYFYVHFEISKSSTPHAVATIYRIGSTSKITIHVKRDIKIIDGAWPSIEATAKIINPERQFVLPIATLDNLMTVVKELRKAAERKYGQHEDCELDMEFAHVWLPKKPEDMFAIGFNDGTEILAMPGAGPVEKRQFANIHASRK